VGDCIALYTIKPAFYLAFFSPAHTSQAPVRRTGPTSPTSPISPTKTFTANERSPNRPPMIAPYYRPAEEPINALSF